MADVVIRPATLADAPAIGILWEKLVAYHNNLDSDLPIARHNGGEIYARSLEHRLEDPYTCLLVAEADDKIVGYVLGVIVDAVPEMFEQTTSGFLADIFVEAAYRHHGVGRTLVEELMDWFRSRGVQQMEWNVAALNEAGFAFWQSIGGRTIMMRMRKDL